MATTDIITSANHSGNSGAANMVQQNWWKGVVERETKGFSRGLWELGGGHCDDLRSTRFWHTYKGEYFKLQFVDSAYLF